MTTKAKAQKEEKFDNPALYAGLKFYDVLMEKQKSFTFFAHTGQLELWRDALEDYFASVSEYMTQNDKVEIAKKLEESRTLVLNYYMFKDKIKNSAFWCSNIKHKLFTVQRELLSATKHLNLKTSTGESGSYDVTKVIKS